MAVILGEVTLNDIDILHVDSHPGLGTGTASPLGSIAICPGLGIFQKTGTSDRSWSNTNSTNPSSYSELFDDFMNNLTVGVLGWQQTQSGTNASYTPAQTVTDIDHPGQGQLSTGTTSTGRVNHFLNQTSTLIGTDLIVVETSINIPVLSASTNEYVFRFGMGDSQSNADNVDGVYFEYNRAISPNWQFKTSTNSTRTSVSSPNLVGTGWTKLRIELKDSTAEFFANDVSVGTISTNVPIGAGRQVGPTYSLAKTSGTTARTINIDFFYMRQLVTR